MLAQISGHICVNVLLLRILRNGQRLAHNAPNGNGIRIGVAVPVIQIDAGTKGTVIHFHHAGIQIAPKTPFTRICIAQLHQTQNPRETALIKGEGIAGNLVQNSPYSVRKLDIAVFVINHRRLRKAAKRPVLGSGCNARAAEQMPDHSLRRAGNFAVGHVDGIILQHAKAVFQGQFVLLAVGCAHARNAKNPCAAVAIIKGDPVALLYRRFIRRQRDACGVQGILISFDACSGRVQPVFYAHAAV